MHFVDFGGNFYKYEIIRQIYIYAEKRAMFFYFVGRIFADGGIVQKGLYERIFMLCRLRDRKVKIFVFIFFFFDFADELFEF